MLSDLDFVRLGRERPGEPAVHHAVGARPARRRGALSRLPPLHHRGRRGYPSAGFVILQGCRNPHGSVELKRIVLQPKGQGYGRTCVRLLAQMAFRDLGAHRFWLDVKSANTRALALYRSEGFVEEGRLRESVR